jgi:hypothetical protein
MESLLHILKDYGAWGLLLVVLVYVLLRGQITFRYPRMDRKDKH